MRGRVFPPYLVWTGIRPGRDDPKAWYDRAIRIVGGLMILVVLTVGVLAKVNGW